MLKKTQLFKGLDEEEIASLFSCLEAKIRSYKKGEYILRQGEVTDSLAVIVAGSVHIQTDDYWGNRSIINSLSETDMFAEAYAGMDGGRMSSDAVAREESTVIFFNLNKMLTVCSAACRFHSLVIQNLFFAVSEKNRRLVGKLGHISKRTTREKLMSYLSEQAKNTKGTHFKIPFNRQQLADFLSVDRSAMSNELGKLRDEGLIEFHKNEFRLL